MKYKRRKLFLSPYSPHKASLVKNQSPAGFNLERIGIWFTIVGVVVSTFFAAYSIFLTIKISRQQTEIKNLNEVINELKTQNRATALEIKELIKQTQLLQTQALLSEKSNSMLSNQIEMSKLDRTILQSKELKDIMDMNVDFINILFKFESIDSSAFVKNLSLEKQLAFFGNILQLLNKGLNNSYIISDKKIYSYWYVFLEQTKTTYQEFLSPSSEYFINSERVTKEQFLISEFSSYKRYFENFQRNGMNALIESPVYKRDRIKQMQRTNFGRPVEK